MSLDVYFKEDVHHDLASSVASFIVGQLSAEKANIAAIKVVLAFAAVHGMKYRIGPQDLRDDITRCLSSLGQNEIVSVIRDFESLTV